MDRTEFLKRAGIGSFGLSALTITPAALAGGGRDGSQHFSLVSLSSTSATEATNHDPRRRR